METVRARVPWEICETHGVCSEGKREVPGHLSLPDFEVITFSPGWLPHQILKLLGQPNTS